MRHMIGGKPAEPMLVADADEPFVLSEAAALPVEEPERNRTEETQ